MVSPRQPMAAELARHQTQQPSQSSWLAAASTNRNLLRLRQRYEEKLTFHRKDFQSSCFMSHTSAFTLMWCLISVDWSADVMIDQCVSGDLSFIDVDRLRLLHSFKTKFSQPLVPAFTVSTTVLLQYYYMNTVLLWPVCITAHIVCSAVLVLLILQ